MKIPNQKKSLRIAVCGLLAGQTYLYAQTNTDNSINQVVSKASTAVENAQIAVQNAIQQSGQTALSMADSVVSTAQALAPNLPQDITPPVVDVPTIPAVPTIDPTSVMVDVPSLSTPEREVTATSPTVDAGGAISIPSLSGNDVKNVAPDTVNSPPSAESVPMPVEMPQMVEPQVVPPNPPSSVGTPSKGRLGPVLSIGGSTMGGKHSSRQWSGRQRWQAPVSRIESGIPISTTGVATGAGKLGPVLDIGGGQGISTVRPTVRQWSPPAAQPIKAVPRVKTVPITTKRAKTFYTPNLDQVGGVDIKDIVPGAPEVYTVRKGDTLWRLAKMYLRKPWRWPQLWQGNRDHIRDPHKIYPGQKIYLMVKDGKAILTAQPDVQIPVDVTVPEMPAVNQEKSIAPINDVAIPTFMGVADLARFATHPTVVDPNAYAASPTIVSGHEGRQLFSVGDRVYVNAVLPVGQNYRIYDNFSQVIDPETRKVIGYQADYVGNLQVVRGGEGTNGASTAVVTQTKQEISVGARILMDQPADAFPTGGFAPGTVDGGRVAYLKGLNGTGATQGHELNVVLFTKGANQGVQVGQVYLLFHPTKNLSGVDPVKRFLTVTGEQSVASWFSKDVASNHETTLAPEAFAHLYVFKTGPDFAYGVVLDGEHEVEIGDLVKPVQ